MIFLSKIAIKVDDDTLNIIAKELALQMNDYDITKRVTELIVYDYIPECVKTYLVTRKIEGIKMSSLKLYYLRIRYFFNMMRIPIEKVTVNDARIWLYRLQNDSVDKNGNHMSDRTLDCARTIICTFFKWANAEGYIPINPCINIKPIKYNRRKRQCLTEEELELVRNSCKNLRDKAIIETLYSTGCRVSELINIRKEDLDFTNNEVTLLGKGNKYRQSYINTKAKIAIKQYLDSRTDDCPYLFISLRKSKTPNLSKAGVEKIVKDLGINAGITRRVYPHLIRHTTATLGLQRGMDVTELQKMLGYSNIETTMIYAKVSADNIKNDHKKYIV